MSKLLISSFKGANQAIVDPIFYIVLFFGGIGLFFPNPAIRLSWSFLAGMALLEELAFRYGLQAFIFSFVSYKFLKNQLSLANILTSTIFALAHLFYHPPLWAMSVFFPSLLLGWLWDRYQNIFPCWLVHFFYNFCYFYQT